MHEFSRIKFDTRNFENLQDLSQRLKRSSSQAAPNGAEANQLSRREPWQVFSDIRWSKALRFNTRKHRVVLLKGFCCWLNGRW